MTGFTSPPSKIWFPLPVPVARGIKVSSDQAGWRNIENKKHARFWLNSIHAVEATRSTRNHGQTQIHNSKLSKKRCHFRGQP
jgi:hypothetical protein